MVEQQIGRVDRVGSHWCKKLTQAINDRMTKVNEEGVPLPQIEVRPVVFSGTYDEHNWNVLRERWDDLRAQLHGEVIPRRLSNGDPDGAALIDEISKAAPNFSPSLRID